MKLRNTNKLAYVVITVLVVASAVIGLMLVTNRGGDRDEMHKAHAGSGDHGDEVHLEPEQLAKAGIVTVVAGPGQIRETLRLAARISSDQDSVVHVTPRVEGIVRKIHKGLGDEVVAGEPLADLDSVALGLRVGEYLSAHAKHLAAQQTLERIGELYADRLATLEQILDAEIGVAEKIYEREKELQSKSISTVRPLLEADKALQKARLAKRRELVRLRAERDTELLGLEVGLQQATIDERASRDRLRALGFGKEDISRFAAMEGAIGRFVLRAAGNGIVMDRHLTLNEHVDTDTEAFEIHDLSRVWVLASVYEKDLRHVRKGQDAIVHVSAFPTVDIPGKVALLDYSITNTSRAVMLRIELENGPIDEWPEKFPLRPGMFAKVELVTRSEKAAVVVPASAIVEDEGESFLFVAVPGEPGAFARKAVTVRRGSQGLVEITDGVAPGENVVSAGTFTLKSLARGGELGGGHSH